MPAPKKNPRTIGTVLNEVIERVNNDTQRLRLLEQSSESLLSRINSLEQAMLQARREMQKAFLDTNTRLDLINDRLSKTENTTKEVVNHMKKLVTETRVKELENLVDIYNPVKSSFVTKEELQKALADIRRAKK
jgi:ABC-type transporter Mla subunit MlaD